GDGRPLVPHAGAPRRARDPGPRRARGARAASRRPSPLERLASAVDVVLRRAVALAAATLALGACAGKRIEHGIFHAPSGYRVALPPDGAWRIVDDSRADLELRHRTAAAGMLVNGACDPGVARRGPEVAAPGVEGLRLGHEQ